MARLLENTTKMAPGIGEAGKVVPSNRSTRAVLVLDRLADIESLIQTTSILDNQPININRLVLKAVSREPIPVGNFIEGSSLKVEATIPFPNPKDYQSSLYWIVAGHNSGSRSVDDQQVSGFKDKIRHVEKDHRFDTQTGKSLSEFTKTKTSVKLYFVSISPDNFKLYENSLRLVYSDAFTSYPYDVVGAIKKSCGNNTYVAVADQSTDKILGMTGAEFMNVAGIKIAEIGDSASLKETQGMGLGPLIKRHLFQVMFQAGRIPDLSFTDSRIANDDAVLKANRRAGLELNYQFLLPFHTEIASIRDPGVTIDLMGSDGSTFQTEHMAMTYASKSRIENVIQQYGEIKL